MTRAEEARILATALEVYCVRHGLATSRVGVHLFKGARGGIKLLRKRKYPTRRVLDRVRLFLASPPPPGLHKRPLGGKRIRRDNSTGEWLASKVDALIATHGLSPRIVALHVFNSPHGLDRLRTQKPQKRTVLRVQEFLAAPDIAALREPPKRKRAERPVFLPPVRQQRPRRTFEEMLRMVESGKVGIAPALRLPSRVETRTLGGVSDWGGF